MNPLLLICATKPEWSFLKKHFAVEQITKFPPTYRLSPTITLVQTGIGPENTQKNLDLIRSAPKTRVLHFGYSGALVPHLKTGDVIVPEVYEWAGELKCTRGLFHSSPTILKNKTEKENAHHRTQAIAVDMEYEIVKKWASELGFTYQALRVIFDEWDEDISFLAENPMMDETGDLKMTQTAGAFLKKPKNILSIPRLQKMASLANRSLEKVLLPMLSILEKNSHL